MKPDWKDAPTWAKYLAMDADGVWYWYENKPVKLGDDESWTEFTGRQPEQASSFTNWRKSLEQRPD